MSPVSRHWGRFGDTEPGGEQQLGGGPRLQRYLGPGWACEHKLGSQERVTGGGGGEAAAITVI